MRVSYLNYGIQGYRVEIRPFGAAPTSRSDDKGHLKVKNGPKRKHHIIPLFVVLCG